MPACASFTTSAAVEVKGTLGNGSSCTAAGGEATAGGATVVLALALSVGAPLLLLAESSEKAAVFQKLQPATATPPAISANLQLPKIFAFIIPLTFHCFAAYCVSLLTSLRGAISYTQSVFSFFMPF
jgi:hypothetical protein